jgi:hypothetical protein
MERHPNDLTTDEEIDAALERARTEPEPPRIVEAKYHRDLDLFVLKISNGRRLVLQRENLQFISKATPEQAAVFTIEPRGRHIWWPEIDEGFTTMGLLEGRTGNMQWMENLRQVAVAA